MGDWPRHPDKDLQRLLNDFHTLGWRVDKPAAYYRLRCPCGVHKRMVHISPSDPNYGRNVRRWLARQDCPGKIEGENS